MSATTVNPQLLRRLAGQRSSRMLTAEVGADATFRALADARRDLLFGVAGAEERALRLLFTVRAELDGSFGPHDDLIEQLVSGWMKTTLAEGGVAEAWRWLAGTFRLEDDMNTLAGVQELWELALNRAQVQLLLDLVVMTKQPDLEQVKQRIVAESGRPLARRAAEELAAGDTQTLVFEWVMNSRLCEVFLFTELKRDDLEPATARVFEQALMAHGIYEEPCGVMALLRGPFGAMLVAHTIPEAEVFIDRRLAKPGRVGGMWTKQELRRFRSLVQAARQR